MGDGVAHASAGPPQRIHEQWCSSCGTLADVNPSSPRRTPAAPRLVARRGAGRSRPLAVIAALLALVALLAGCSSDSSGSDGGRATTTTTAAAPGSTSTPVEEFTGSVDDFYRVPDPLPAGRPGDLIRTQKLDAPAGQVGLRIMYHSQDRLGKDRAVTGQIYYPTEQAPADGWPVLLTDHGTTGIISECAPSRTPLVPGDYGVKGVRVASDYIGLGPVGEVHPYLSATAEGNASIDAVVAAHHIAAAHAGKRFVVVGHSQGGHASLITSEIAAKRAPQYELLGAVATAPGAQFTESYNDDIQIRIITSMVLFGSESEWPDMKASDYLSPKAYAEAKKIILNNCLDKIVPAMIPIAASPDFYRKDPQTSGEAKKFMEANDPAQVVSKAPLLLMTGGKDIIVVPARVAALRQRLCAMGQVTQYVFLPNADHGSEPIEGKATIDRWVQDRFAGTPAPDNCAEVRTGS